MNGIEDITSVEIIGSVIILSLFFFKLNYWKVSKNKFLSLLVNHTFHLLNCLVR